MTERDVVLRERAAFLNGVWQAHIDRLVCEDKHRTVGLYEWDAECNKALLNTNGAAQIHYPLLVTQPRVVTDPHAPDYDHRWKCEGGQLFWSAAWTTGPRWEPLAAMKDITDTTCGFPTPERIALWADLLARPTEQVDA